MCFEFHVLVVVAVFIEVYRQKIVMSIVLRMRPFGNFSREKE
jgi:hypothetical protein